MCNLFETVVLHAYIHTHRLDNLFFPIQLYKLIGYIKLHHTMLLELKIKNCTYIWQEFVPSSILRLTSDAIELSLSVFGTEHYSLILITKTFRRHSVQRCSTRGAQGGGRGSWCSQRHYNQFWGGFFKLSVNFPIF